MQKNAGIGGEPYAVLFYSWQTAYEFSACLFARYRLDFI
jgi:hypothetical protein